MKIHACSNWQLKFLGPVLEWWRTEDHEVRYELGYNPEAHAWSDVCFVDVCDHNAKVASGYRFPSSRLVIRVIDIEAWVGQPGGVTWENVDAVVFGAKHIEALVKEYVQFPDTVEISHVPFGIDIDKWTFGERSLVGRRMAFVAHRWSAKGLPLLLQIMARLPAWTLYILGTPSREKWLHAYFDYMVKELNLDVRITERVNSVDDWLADKDALLVTSQKETFSYACAEAAAKGIRPVIHNWLGARDIWPSAWIWNTVEEAVAILHEPYESILYREFIMNTYPIERMMAGLNKACRLE